MAMCEAKAGVDWAIEFAWNTGCFSEFSYPHQYLTSRFAYHDNRLTAEDWA